MGKVPPTTSSDERVSFIKRYICRGRYLDEVVVVGGDCSCFIIRLPFIHNGDFYVFSNGSPPRVVIQQFDASLEYLDIEIIP